MRCFYRAFFAATVVAVIHSGYVYGEQKFQMRDGTSQPPIDDKSKPRPTLDCSRPNTDPRCRPSPPPYYYPQPYRQRPVIINQLPEQPAIEINSLTDDWEGCRTAKLGAISARKSGHADEANNLDEWLWKNCRSYSNELRQLEQNDM